MSFDAAHENFTSAARNGLDATLYWPGTGWIHPDELVLRKLLPMAAEGLARWGVAPEVCDRYLPVIEQRCLTGAGRARRGRSRPSRRWKTGARAGRRRCTGCSRDTWSTRPRTSPCTAGRCRPDAAARRERADGLAAWLQPRLSHESGLPAFRRSQVQTVLPFGPPRRTRSYCRRRRRGPIPAATHRGRSGAIPHRAPVPPARAPVPRAHERRTPCPTTTATGDLHVALPPLRPTARARARRCPADDSGGVTWAPGAWADDPAPATRHARPVGLDPVRSRPRPGRAPVRLRSPSAPSAVDDPPTDPSDSRRSRRSPPCLVGAGPAAAPPPGGVRR